VILLGGGYFWLLLLVLPPLITMRMISEESRSGMLEFLLTSPVSDAAVVTGKALAATTFFALAFASTFLFALLVAAIGASPDWGRLLAAWIGACLASALFSALGLLASAVFSTPLLAAFFAIFANISLFTLPGLVHSWRGPVGEWLGSVLGQVNVSQHYVNSFPMGAIDSAHVLFFLAWTAAVLFLAVRAVESRRWLG
jgi:ABC-2 type transport system permease protein